MLILENCRHESANGLCIRAVKSTTMIQAKHRTTQEMQNLSDKMFKKRGHLEEMGAHWSIILNLKQLHAIETFLRR